MKVLRIKLIKALKEVQRNSFITYPPKVGPG